MSKYEIHRTDINKRVCPPTDFRDAEYAAGQYIAALTLAGVLRSADDYTHDGGDRYTLRTIRGESWPIEVRACA